MPYRKIDLKFSYTYNMIKIKLTTRKQNIHLIKKKSVNVLKGIIKTLDLTLKKTNLNN